MFTSRIDPAESVEGYVTIQNCTVNIEPTDEKMTDLKFDTGALRFEQSISRGTQMITISSISGKRMRHVKKGIYRPDSTATCFGE